MSLIGTGLGLAALAGSLALLWAGLRTHRFANALAAARPLGEEAGTGGMTVAEGTIQGPQPGASLESDWSGTPCVAYATKRIKQEGIPGPHDPDPEWNTGRERLRTDHEAVPFVLDTDVGPVHVQAGGAHVEVGRDHYQPVSIDAVRENRGALVALWWWVRRLWTSADRSVRREYLEALFRPGDRIHVLGALSADGSNGRAIQAPGGGPLVVSSRPPEGVVGRFKSKAKGRLTWGVILLAVATLIFLALAGVIG